MIGLFERLKSIIAGTSAEPDPPPRAEEPGPRPQEDPQEDKSDPRWWPAESDQVHTILEAATEEDARIQREAPPSGYRTKLTAMDVWSRILETSETLQTEIAVHAAQREWGLGARKGKEHWSGEDGSGYRYWHGNLYTALVSHLFRRRLPFSAAQLTYLVTLGGSMKFFSTLFPFAPVLSAVERFCGGQPPPAELARALERMDARIVAEWNDTAPMRKTRARIERLLHPEPADRVFALPDDDWGARTSPWLAGLGTDERAAWERFLAHAASAGDRPRPPKKWLAEAERLVAGCGRTAVEQKLGDWLRETDQPSHLSDEGMSLFKGLIWSSVHLDHARIAAPVGDFAERCFRKVPGWGPAAPALGNACVLALGMMGDGDEVAAQLVRIETRVRYDAVRGRVKERLGEMADDAGVSVADLEETSLPRFGLDDDGVRREVLGDATAVITMEPGGPVLSWLGADGRSRKTVPAAVKRDHAEAVKDLKRQVKDMEAARRTQIVRLEASWLDGRDWSLDDWRERYLGHPLRSAITRGLIWRFESGDTSLSAMPRGEGFVTSSGAPATPPPGARVRLWHPLDAASGEVAAWRARIVEQELTQPIKQAHRETYVLTDAERETRDYSNRFAAHILRQHQFRALCQAREWRYDYQGGWDSWSVPTRTVPGRGLAVEFRVEAIAEGAHSSAGVPLHVTTDRVRFTGNDGAAIPLSDVPPLVFSEAMRDVDLFVSVTSVASDPDWTDGGPDGDYGDYWRDTAFGELGETAKTRRELIAEIAPKLAIADRLAVTDRFLDVQGNLHCYRIHLGSGNVRVLPDNRNLCIVRSAGARTERGIYLPFHGDMMLSMILSKAFLLAADDKITDPTILSQLPK